MRLQCCRDHNPNGMIILTYHNVDAAPAGVAQPWLYVAPEAFAEQMRLLEKFGFRGVSVSEGLRLMQSGKADRSVIITFDDGYVDNLTHAAPALARYGFSATCYVVSSCIGSYNSWDADALGAKKPLMNGAQLHAWLDYGMEIGSHSRSHYRLDLLPPAAAREEISASRDDLRSIMGIDVEHFCYPYGGFNATTAALAKDAGYKSAVTTVPGRARSANDPYTLPRIAPRGDESNVTFALKSIVPAGWAVSHSMSRMRRKLAASLPTS
jgi:peptidoglycan/xylan/chitin deacetylase (PgdA/CDA1 family)